MILMGNAMKQYAVTFAGNKIGLVEAESKDEALEIVMERIDYNARRKATYNDNVLLYEDEDSDAAQDFIDWIDEQIDIEEIDNKEQYYNEVLNKK